MSFVVAHRRRHRRLGGWGLAGGVTAPGTELPDPSTYMRTSTSSTSVMTAEPVSALPTSVMLQRQGQPAANPLFVGLSQSFLRPAGPPSPSGADGSVTVDSEGYMTGSFVLESEEPPIDVPGEVVDEVRSPTEGEPVLPRPAEAPPRPGWKLWVGIGLGIFVIGGTVYLLRRKKRR